MSGQTEDITVDGKESVNSALIWTDNPELEYFRSMMTNEEDGRLETEDSLIGDSTIREMFEVAGSSLSHRPGVRDTSGLSDTESNTVDNIYIEDGSLLNQKQTQSRLFDDGTIETPEDEELVPDVMKAQVVQNIDRNPNIEYETPKNIPPHVEQQCIFAPAEQITPQVIIGDENTVSKESVSIPGFIFVTDGRPSIVRTKSADPQPSKEKHERRRMCLPRTLLICMTLVVLVASTVIAVLVYQMKTDTSALTSSSSQSQNNGSPTIKTNPQPTSAPSLRANSGSKSQAPTMDFNSGNDSNNFPSMPPSVSISDVAGTPTPTKKPTTLTANTPVPTLSFTELPTSAPTIPPTFLPTYSPTIPPTKRPTVSPTHFPTRSTDSPTMMPTEAASVKLTTAETCISTIQTDKDCYVAGDNIKISFNNCDPTSEDWIGVYPASQGTSNLNSPLAWVWTCNDEECADSDQSAGVASIYNVSRRGRYRAFLIREDATSAFGYSAYASSNRFAIRGSCTQQ